MGLSVPAQLTVRNSSIRLFEVSNRGHPRFRPAARADFLWLEEASTRGSSHFHAVLLNKAALPDEIQGRDALGDDRGDLIVKRAVFLKNYPLTSSENVICVHQRPRSPATNMLDLGVWKSVALPDKKFAWSSRSAQLQDMVNSVRHAAAHKRKQERRKAETQEEHIYGPGGRLPESSRDAIKDICLAYSKQVQNTMFCLCCAYSRTLLSGTKPEWQWDETTTCQWLCNAAFRREGPRRGLDYVWAGADASCCERNRFCRPVTFFPCVCNHKFSFDCVLVKTLAWCSGLENGTTTKPRTNDLFLYVPRPTRLSQHHSFPMATHSPENTRTVPAGEVELCPSLQ